MKRLMSLDVMRGITIAGMILVNNPGSWGHLYAPLAHAEWLGLTPTDLVFPFFMFVMGVSTFLSLKKYGFTPSMAAVTKIVRRSFLLLLIGWAIIWFARTWSGLLNPNMTWWEAVNNFDTIRTLGVFPRLAICYCVTALLAITVSRKAMGWIAASIMALYAILLFVGNGFEFSDNNIVAIIDQTILGPAHMYHDTVDGVTLAFDPEGLLSTLPSIAHCIIGFLCGYMITTSKDQEKASYHLLIVGFVLTAVGFLLDYGLPISKKLWTPTFVFVTCGLGASLLGLLIWIIDIKGYKRWCTFFRVFGVNALALYVLSTLIAITLNRISFTVADPENPKISLQRLIYQNFLVPLCQNNETLASLIFALLFVLTCWVVGYILYRNKVYIKV